MNDLKIGLTRYLEACSADEPRRRIAAARLQRMQNRFTERFSRQPVHLVRAPGRVNLIGEHTDYNGYPVLPLAIDRDVWVLMAGRADDEIHIANTLTGFGERGFSVPDASTPFALGDWGNYVKAAVVGLREQIASSGRGLNAVFDGTVPPAAGLSSSSALVVASALTFLTANNKDMDRLQLAELLAQAERFVGTAGGGMDQAISLMGQPGKALKIDFFPLSVQSASLPQGYQVVICNSMVAAPKTESALAEYNRRPRECRLAALLLCNYLSRKLNRAVSARRLADLAPFGLSEEEAAPVLGPDPLSMSELLTRLHMTLPELLQMLGIAAIVAPADGWKLWSRYLHIVREAGLVQQAFSAMLAGDAAALGRLMNESHRGCRDLYELSTPELDALVEFAREAGAVGSRLTGAGFGGCTVSLVAENQLNNFMHSVRTHYYDGYLRQRRPELLINGLAPDFLFATGATAGAAVLI